MKIYPPDVRCVLLFRGTCKSSGWLGWFRWRRATATKHCYL